MMCAEPAKSRGVALITALLVVALATIAAVSMASRQQLDLRRTSNVLHGDQAYLYVWGVENWAGRILTRDAEEAGDTATDHLNEDWATILPPIQVEGGEVSGHIEDMQGRFNLNNLITDNKINETELKRFQRLLDALGIETNLANAVLDWMDSDLQPRFPDGAEEDEYLKFEPPYRNPNTPFVDVSELRLVKGMTPAVYTALAPYITALPKATSINVNTAPALVLRTLADGITETDAQSLVDARETEPFTKIDDFLQQDALAGRDIGNEGLSVTSEFFRVKAEAQIGQTRSRLTSLLVRDANGAITVLARSQGIL